MGAALQSTSPRPSVGSVPALYAIADGNALGPDAVPAAVGALAAAGVSWIQIRLKNVDDRDFHDLVAESLRRLDETSADPLVWIDDRADLAAIFEDARPSRRFGVHVGQRDLSPAAVRRVVGAAMPVGFSCHDEDQVRSAEADGDVDVVAIGPVHATGSKADPDPVVGLDGVRAARRLTHKPLVAIGGLGPGRLAPVRAAGADAAVVLSALGTDDLRSRAAALLAEAQIPAEDDAR